MATSQAASLSWNWTSHWLAATRLQDWASWLSTRTASATFALCCSSSAAAAAPTTSIVPSPSCSVSQGKRDNNIIRIIRYNPTGGEIQRNYPKGRTEKGRRRAPKEREGPPPLCGEREGETESERERGGRWEGRKERT